jgi:hypothetical protein
MVCFIESGKCILRYSLESLLPYCKGCQLCDGHIRSLNGKLFNSCADLVNVTDEAFHKISLANFRSCHKVAVLKIFSGSSNFEHTFSG